MLIKLRPITNGDVDDLVRLANNPKIAANLRDAFPHPYTIANGIAFIETIQKDSTNFHFVIEADEHFAGMVGVHAQEDVYRFNAEIGYWIAEEFWGKGIATNAIKQVADFTFAQTEIKRIFAGVFSYNHASLRVLEKAGFRREGISHKSVFKNGTFHDEIRFALIKKTALF